MNWALSPPSTDAIIRLLKAWRFWSIGALLGALLGAAVYYLAPPAYRAHAIVLVDFNMEQAWPEETDRQQFYYLERETRKLEEIAWSDLVIGLVAERNGNITTQELRDGKLSLSQPAEGGWNFYADDRDPERAAAIVRSWARVFVEQVRSQAELEEGPSSFIEARLTQAPEVPTDRRISLEVYMFAGAVSLLALASFFILFFDRPR
jgi:capsular polysaccharide biosynthesis protein